jgi:hypothetical protein
MEQEATGVMKKNVRLNYIPDRTDKKLSPLSRASRPVERLRSPILPIFYTEKFHHGIFASYSKICFSRLVADVPPFGPRAPLRHLFVDHVTVAV